jgi:hypothetical protein
MENGLLVNRGALPIELGIISYTLLNFLKKCGLFLLIEGLSSIDCSLCDSFGY